MTAKSKRLLGSSLISRSILSGQTDPMATMGNLMDVMLVFACGLMIALIARYSVDLGASSQDLGRVERINADLVQVQEGIANSNSKYVEVGTTYRDIETGELYIVIPDDGTE